MGGVKTLRTGFLVFGPGFKWFTLLAENVLGVRFLCQPWRLPGEAGVESSSPFRPETAPRSRPPLQNRSFPLGRRESSSFLHPTKGLALRGIRETWNERVRAARPPAQPESWKSGRPSERQSAGRCQKPPQRLRGRPPPALRAFPPSARPPRQRTEEHL